MAKIQPVQMDPANYDIVIIGMLNRASDMSSPVRTYLTENQAKFKNVEFFSTEGIKGGSEKSFAEIEKVAGKKLKETLNVKLSELKDGSDMDKVKKFAGEI